MRGFSHDPHTRSLLISNYTGNTSFFKKNYLLIVLRCVFHYKSVYEKVLAIVIKLVLRNFGWNKRHNRQEKDDFHTSFW